MIRKLILIAALAATGCAENKDEVRSYRVELDGAPVDHDRMELEYSGVVSWTRTQRYRLTAMTGPTTPAHFVVAEIVQTFGNKSRTVEKMGLISVVGGSAMYDCTEYIAVKPSAEEGAPNPTCKLKILGHIDMTGRAAVEKGD